jgi:hypothetical protein
MTATYIHIDPSVSEDEEVQRGEEVGTIAAIEFDHLDFGIRTDSYDDPNAHRGALPKSETTCPDKGYLPAYPEEWVDPLDFEYDTW